MALEMGIAYLKKTNINITKSIMPSSLYLCVRHPQITHTLGIQFCIKHHKDDFYVD